MKNNRTKELMITSQVALPVHKEPKEWLSNMYYSMIGAIEIQNFQVLPGIWGNQSTRKLRS